MIENISYLSDGALDVKTIFVYNENGDKQERIISFSDRPGNNTLYKYDGGYLVEMEDFYDGSPDGKSSYINDSNGNVIEASEYKPNGELKGKSTSVYDENNYRTEVNMFKPDGSHARKSTITYNENGDVVDRSDYDHEGNIRRKETYKYEYDSNKNWTNQIVYDGDSPQFIVGREIEYYK